MKTIKTLVFILTTTLLLSCAKKQGEVQKGELKSELNAYLDRAMKVHGVPGLALAVVKDGGLVYKGIFGKAMIENNEPVGDKTIFRVFSTTKLLTSTGIFQLAEKGMISTEDKLSRYFENLPDHWQNIKIKHLLTHSSGLPDLRYSGALADEAVMAKLFNDSMGFETGAKFRYNQTNYWLLARIIEKVSGSSFEGYILKNQFNSAKEGVLFSSNSKEGIASRATRYYYNGRSNVFEKDTIDSGQRAHSGNGLNITLDEFINWNTRLDIGELLSNETKEQMWTPFTFGNGKDEFLYGWGIYRVDGKTSYGFTGGNLSGFRKFVDDDMTIILLSNGYVHPGYDIIINDISRIILGDGKKSNPVFEQDVMKHLLEKKYEVAKTIFRQLRDKDTGYNFDNLKWNINGMGNTLLRNAEFDEACSVYRLNAEVNADWWVAQAGYAEGLEKKGDTLKAIDLYQKAIRLNSNNEYDYNTFMKERINNLKP